MLGRGDGMQLLWISGIDGFCHRYEVLHRVAQAELLGARSVVRHFTDARLVRDAARADLVLAYRTPETPLVCTVLARARARGVPVLGTIDDLIFLPDDASQPAQAGWSAEARATWRDGVRRYRAVLDACDGFIAPTEPLLDAARALGWRSWLHRDALSAAELALGEDARRRAREARDRRDLVLGYFSGTPTHDRDFSSITGALADVLRRRPGCTLLVVGPLVLDAALQPLAGRIQRRPLVPWTELPGVLAGVDVCLAPLELDRPFAAAKGEVKYLEAAAVGVPTIATPTPAYRAAIAHGRTGMLADGPDAWRRALEELIEDPERRRALGAAARDDVAARFSPEVRARELRDILVAALAEPVRVARVPGAAPRPRAARGANVADEALVPDVGQGRVALESDARPVITLASHDAVSPPLASGVGLVQSLPRAPRDLRRLDLWTVTYGQRLEGVVTLRVIADDGRVLVRRRRRACTAPDRAWWSFAIPARCCRAARAARLELTWAGTPGAAALSFGLAAQPVRNPLQAA
ncbi:glycosyltransferase, partial [Candidatus Binatia bacterium]|nr:glycosyltransferase [Candidatus Binatia bacterium]